MFDFYWLHIWSFANHKNGICSFWFCHLYTWTNFSNVNYSLCETQVKSPYRLRYPLNTGQTQLPVTGCDMCVSVLTRNQRWVIDLCEVDIYASFVCWIGWLPTDIGENSQPEVYAACLLRKSQNTNKVAISKIQSGCICKHVMHRQEINISLPCSCKVDEMVV